MALFVACQSEPAYDVVIRNGTVYDGSGDAPIVGDVAIIGDSIVAVGVVTGSGRTEVDAKGMAVSPGFINMLSWATESLIEDGRSQSDIRQGVTLEVMGEGESMGPLSDTLRTAMLAEQGDLKFPITWRTLRGYQDSLVRKGISTNIASFVGATTVRINHVGWADRAPTPSELEAMQAEVRTAMEEGALGVGSSLIYAPAFYARTPELVALMKAAAPYGGMYISHMRSEGVKLEEAVDELLTIAKESGARAEIYHLKAAGEANWPKMARVLDRIDSARARDSRSRQTSIPIRRVPRVSMRRCRPGCRRVDTPSGRGVCATRPFASAWRKRCARQPTSGRVSCSLPVPRIM